MPASCLLLQGLHDGVIRTDLHHLVHGRVAPKCLSFHDALHVGCPAVVLITVQQGEDMSLSSGDCHLLHLLIQDLFHEFVEVLKLGLALLHLLLPLGKV